MATLFVPNQLRGLTDGESEFLAVGGTLREVLQDAHARFPQFVEQIVHDGELMPGIAVAIDGAMTNRGLLAKVSPTSEVHFLPAIGAG